MAKINIGSTMHYIWNHAWNGVSSYTDIPFPSEIENFQSKNLVATQDQY